MKKRWVINTPPEATKIEELSKKLNCHPVIANLLLQRGITSSEQAQSFFYPSLNMNAMYICFVSPCPIQCDNSHIGVSGRQSQEMGHFQMHRLSFLPFVCRCREISLILHRSCAYDTCESENYVLLICWISRICAIFKT